MKHIYSKSSLTLRTSLLSKTILTLLAALTFSGNAWGKYFYAKCRVISQPEAGGYVYVSQSAKEDDTYSFVTLTDDITGSKKSGYATSGTSSKSIDFFAYQKTNTGYTFEGWSTDPNAASGSTEQKDHKYGGFWGIGAKNCKYYPLSVTSTRTSESNPTIGTYYAIFRAHTYQIHFNNNGGSGQMGSLDCTYDKNVTLTTNSFTRIGYTFDGWYTNAGCTGTKYEDGATVKNLTATDNGEVTLYAKWKANTYYVKFNGNGNSSGSMTNQTLTYDKAANLKANAFARSYTVTYDANGGSCAKSSETTTYTFGGWAESATGEKKYNNQESVTNLTSTNGATINLYALWTNGTITLPAATKTGKVFDGWGIIAGTDTTYIGAKNANYDPTSSVTLKALWTDIASPKYNWNGVESKTYRVGDPALDLNELWVSNNEDTKNFELVSFTPSGTNNTDATAPTLADGILTSGQAGEVTVKVTQPASDYFYAGEAELTLTINKHENTILVKGVENYRKEIEINSYDNGFTFAATNTDYANYPINVEQIAGQNIATYYPDQKAVYSGKMSGEAVWQVTQAENYYYEADTATLAIDVRLAAEVVCYVVNDASEHSFTTLLDFEGHFDTPIAVSDPVKSLSFSARKDSWGANYFVAQYSTDNGNSWKDIVSPDLSDSYQNFGPYNLPVHNITHIRFGAKVGGTLSKYYKNIKLTRFTYLDLSEESMTFDKTNTDQPLYCGDAVTKTFTINWSMPENGTQINIASTNSKFTVSSTTISNTGCNDGNNTITVTYSSDVAGTFNGKIIINNEVFFKEIAVSGTTVKRNQTIEWNQQQNYITTDAITLAATATSELDPTYTVVSGDDVATVDENGVVTVLKAGDVTFRASQAGDGCYNEAESVDREFHIDLAPGSLTMNNGNVIVSTLEDINTIDLSELKNENNTAADDGELSFEVISANAAHATLDENNFSADALGDYTIRATKAETDFFTSATAEFTVSVIEGVIFTGTNGNWDEAGNWSGDEVPGATDRVIINADVELSEPFSVAGLTINEGKTVTIKDGGVLIVGDKQSLTRDNYGNIIIEAGGQLLLNEGNVDINDFTLYSGFDGNRQPKSGQVTGAEQLNAHGEAYFVLDLDPDGVATYGWYSFTVPFQVNAMSGVEYFKEGSWHQMVNEQNYAIMDYHEDLRAQGKYGWKKYRSILQPNTGYIITVDDELGINTVRFRKEQSAVFNTEMTQQLTATVVEGGAVADKGWNYIGNGTTSYINYGSTTIYAQVLDHAANVYNISMASSNTMVVGAAYVVQAANNTTLTMVSANETTTGLLRAPERETISSDAINISLRADQKTCDRLFITYGDEAAQTYTIGKDVKKMGTTSGASVARMWANAKGEQLAAVDMAFADNQVIVPLSLYAPATADFSIALADYPAEDVYLLHNGSIIADLTFSDHSLTLNAGTDNSYALLIVRRVSNVATGVDNMHEDANRGMDFVEKIMVNGQLYILRNGTLYDVQGRKATKL